VRIQPTPFSASGAAGGRLKRGGPNMGDVKISPSQRHARRAAALAGWWIGRSDRLSRPHHDRAIAEHDDGSPVGWIKLAKHAH
jgi:hypothetical protein